MLDKRCIINIHAVNIKNMPVSSLISLFLNFFLDASLGWAFNYIAIISKA